MSSNLESVTRKEAALNFARLPMDIHTLILLRLPPSDIMSFRKTCKSMLEASVQRIVWIKALERMCSENTVYFPSFRTDEMDIHELEYATMAPKRWEVLIKSRESSLEGPIPSFATRKINIPASLDEPDRLYLVPGGRFLVVLQEYHLTLWDLGSFSGALNEIVPIHSIYSDCYSFTTHMSSDGPSSTLRILAITRQFDEMTYFFEMFEIAPWSSTPQFTLLATLYLVSEYELHFSSVCGDLVAIVHGPIIKLWNFKTNKWASWNTNDVSLQILMTERSITLIHYSHLAIWDIPNLVQDARLEAVNPEPQAVTLPRSVLPYCPSYSMPDGYSCHGLCDWYTGSPQPLWFDNISERTETTSYQLSRFDAGDTEHSLRLNLSFEFPHNGNTFIAPYRVCGQHVIILWCNPHGIHCHTGSSNVDKITTLCRMEDVHTTLTSFCPISGRLAYFTSRTEAIQVVDFLPPVRT